MVRKNYFIKPTIKSRASGMKSNLLRSLSKLTGIQPREPKW